MIPQPHITFESIIKAIGQAPPHLEIFASAEALHHIAMLPEFNQEKRFPEIMVGAYKIQVSPCLPVEVAYDACDLENRREVKIPSGEWIHFIAIPPPKIETALLFDWRGETGFPKFPNGMVSQFSGIRPACRATK